MAAASGDTKNRPYSQMLPFRFKDMWVVHGLKTSCFLQPSHWLQTQTPVTRFGFFLPPTGLRRVYMLPLGGESRGRVLGATAGI